MENTMRHPLKQFPDSNFGKKQLKKSITTKFAVISVTKFTKFAVILSQIRKPSETRNTDHTPHAASRIAARPRPWAAAFLVGVSPATPEP